MDTNTIGKLTELKVLTYITELGYSVSIPFGDKDRYDQIWDINGKLLRVQIKTSRWKTEQQKSIIFSCKTSYARSSGVRQHVYTKDDIDFFATYWNNKVYLIPVEECSSEKTLWFEKPSNGCTRCRFAKDYEVEEVLKRIC